MVVIYLGRRGNTCNYASITRVTNARPGGFYHWRAVVARELGFRGALSNLEVVSERNQIIKSRVVICWILILNRIKDLSLITL